MKTIYIVYGRKTNQEVELALDITNRFGRAEIFGVFDSFDDALTEFKKSVAEARDDFFENNPLFMSCELEEKAQAADLFSNYNFDLDTELSKNGMEFSEENNIRWCCDISYLSEFCSWEIYPIYTLNAERIIPASIYLVRADAKEQE